MTEWVRTGLPEKFRHHDIRFHRVRVSEDHDAYHIGFAQSHMPDDYRIPDGYEIIDARVERLHPPHRSRWQRVFLPKKRYLTIVVREGDIG